MKDMKRDECQQVKAMRMLLLPCGHGTRVSDGAASGGPLSALRAMGDGDAARI